MAFFCGGRKLWSQVCISSRLLLTLAPSHPNDKTFPTEKLNLWSPLLAKYCSIYDWGQSESIDLQECIGIFTCPRYNPVLDTRKTMKSKKRGPKSYYWRGGRLFALLAYISSLQQNFQETVILTSQVAHYFWWHSGSSTTKEIRCMSRAHATSERQYGTH